MKFSIIVPVYNVEQYLKQALDSILYQTYQEYEVIVVNDGSTDSSLEICQSYQKKFEHMTIVNQKNGGLSEARNTGIKYAKGEFIYFFDSDDYMHPSLLETINKKIQLDNSLDMIQFGYTSFKNKDMKDDKEELSTISKDIVLNNEQLLNELYNGKRILYTAWSYVIRTSIVQSNDLNFIPKIVNEDVPFLYLCIKFIKRYLCLSDSLYYYRRREGSITQSFNRAPRVYSLLIIISNLYGMYYKENKDNFYAKFIWKKLQDELNNYLLEAFSVKEAMCIYNKYSDGKSISVMKVLFKRIKYFLGFHIKNVVKRFLRLLHLY